MKTTHLITSLAFLGSTAFAAESASSSSSAASAVVVQPGGKGKAVITIDVNGKRETREIEFGNATEIKVGNDNIVTLTSDSISVNNKPVRKTWLGIAADDVPDELGAQLPIAEGTGLLVRSLSDDGPAAKAGLTKNDVLVKFDDQILTNADQLRALVGTKKEGDTVRLTYLRRGQELVAEVKLGAREGGDDTGLGSIFNGKTWNFDAIKNLAAPLRAQSRAVIIDKDGNVVTTKATEEISETIKQLERTLRDSGVDKKVIDETKRALSETAESLRKAAGEIGAAKGEVLKEVERAVKEAGRAMEEARKAAEEAHRELRSPVPPTKPEPKVEKDR